MQISLLKKALAIDGFGLELKWGKLKRRHLHLAKGNGFFNEQTQKSQTENILESK